jgi:hypothetical protein
VRRALALVLLLAVASLAEDAKNPLERAKVGQWVRYKMANDMAMKQSVAKVEGGRVTIKNDMWVKGRALPAQETTVDAKPKRPEGDKKNDAKSENVTLEINGHKLACRLITNANVHVWVSDEVPITGIVRQELSGKTTMELDGYGDAADEDRLKKP